MNSSKFHKKTWIVGVVFFLLLILLSFFSTSDSPKQYPSFLTESPSLTGTKAIYTYLKQQSDDVTRVTSLPHEETNTEELRMMINPPVLTDKVAEESYLEYIEKGNTLVIWKENPNDLFGIEATLQVDPYTKQTQQPSQVQSPNNSYEAVINSAYRLESTEQDNVLLEDSYGVLALERRIGDGHLIVITEPNWLTNDQITDYEHTEIIFDTLSFERFPSITFDEFHFHSSNGLVSPLKIFPGWAYVLFVEGIIFALFVLWYQGKRFGPIRIAREEHVRLGDERLNAVAIWHLKGKNYKSAILHQVDYLKEAIRERYGIPYDNSWQKRMEHLVPTLESLSTKDATYFAQELETVLNKDKINKYEFLTLSASIEKIREEVETR